jgi:hypothetical protein
MPMYVGTVCRRRLNYSELTADISITVVLPAIYRRPSARSQADVPG